MFEEAAPSPTVDLETSSPSSPSPSTSAVPTSSSSPSSPVSNHSPSDIQTEESQPQEEEEETTLTSQPSQENDDDDDDDGFEAEEQQGDLEQEEEEESSETRVNGTQSSLSIHSSLSTEINDTSSNQITSDQFKSSSPLNQVASSDDNDPQETLMEENEESLESLEEEEEKSSGDHVDVDLSDSILEQEQEEQDHVEKTPDEALDAAAEALASSIMEESLNEVTKDSRTSSPIDQEEREAHDALTATVQSAMAIVDGDKDPFLNQPSPLPPPSPTEDIDDDNDNANDAANAQDQLQKGSSGEDTETETPSSPSLLLKVNPPDPSMATAPQNTPTAVSNDVNDGNESNEQSVVKTKKRIAGGKKHVKKAPSASRKTTSGTKKPALLASVSESSIATHLSGVSFEHRKVTPNAPGLSLTQAARQNPPETPPWKRTTKRPPAAMLGPRTGPVLLQSTPRTSPRPVIPSTYTELFKLSLGAHSARAANLDNAPPTMSIHELLSTASPRHAFDSPEPHPPQSPQPAFDKAAIMFAIEEEKAAWAAYIAAGRPDPPGPPPQHPLLANLDPRLLKTLRDSVAAPGPSQPASSTRTPRRSRAPVPPARAGGVGAKMVTPRAPRQSTASRAAKIDSSLAKREAAVTDRVMSSIDRSQARGRRSISKASPASTPRNSRLRGSIMAAPPGSVPSRAR